MPAELKTSRRVQTVTIADGQTTSAGYFTKEDRDLVALHVDSAFDGATLAFNGRLKGETAWKQIAWAQDDPYTQPITAAGGASMDPALFAGWDEIQVVSSAAQAGAACVVTGKFRSFRW